MLRGAAFAEDNSLPRHEESRQAVPDYLVDARSDSLCGALFCNVFTR